MQLLGCLTLLKTLAKRNLNDNKISDVSDKFKKAQEKKEKTIMDKLTEEEKNKKLNELLFDIENLYALLLIGEASDVDIMFNKDGKTMVITDRKQPVNPMELANRVINNRNNMFIAKFSNDPDNPINNKPNTTITIITYLGILNFLLSTKVYGETTFFFSFFLLFLASSISFIGILDV